MAEKVLFLDIDGVLTSARTGWYNMDIYAVNFISWCCQQSGYKIVISSTWRKNHGKDFWDMIFPDLIHEDWATPVLPRGQVYAGEHDTRGKEIEAWLSKHDVTAYIILDDDTDMTSEQMLHFVQTDSGDGLLLNHMTQMRDLMNIEGHFREDAKLYQHQNMFGHHNF